MDHTDHVLLVGDDALRFARRMGFAEQELLTYTPYRGVRLTPAGEVHPRLGLMDLIASRLRLIRVEAQRTVEEARRGAPGRASRRRRRPWPPR